MFENRLFFDRVTSEQIAPYKQKLQDEIKSGEIGYYHLPLYTEDYMQKLKNLKTTKTLKNVVVIGVGGSSLGAKAIASMLKFRKKPNSAKLCFLENLDSDSISDTLSKLDIKNTMFLVVSKSGTTIETISLFKIVLAYFGFDDNFQTLKNNFVFITDEHSALDSFATKYGLQALHIPKNVGGRFSVFSLAGLTPLYLCGYDVKQILQGACLAKDAILQNDDIFYKAYEYIHVSKKDINVLFAYGDLFRDFNEWYVQLWGESLGKINKSGLSVGRTPIGLIGSIDQHSFLQLIIEGKKDKSVTFIKVKNKTNNISIPNISLSGLKRCDFVNNFDANELLKAQCDSTMQSLIETKITPIDTILLDEICEQSVSYLMYYFEMLTSISGIMLDIDTYNQPGVEIGKKLLNQKIK